MFTGDERVRKLSLPTEVGRVLMRQCAESIKKLSLELGGNAPFIVFDDADIDKAVEGADRQVPQRRTTCVCVNRFYIHRAVYDHSAINSSPASPPPESGRWQRVDAQIGPLINADAGRSVPARRRPEPRRHAVNWR